MFLFDFRATTHNHDLPARALQTARTTIHRPDHEPLANPHPVIIRECFHVVAPRRQGIQTKILAQTTEILPLQVAGETLSARLQSQTT